MKKIISSADQWRQDYNPLRGLTIQRAVSLLECGQRGEFADLMWTYDFVEQTDPVLMALLERRTAAICEMDWNVKEVRNDVRGFDKALAEDQGEALREAYERIDNLYDAIEHWETGAFRGFAHCNPQFNSAGDINHLECLDSWNFVRDGRYGSWYWNPEAKQTSATALGDKAKLKAEDLITMEVKRSIDRIGLIKFVRANMSEKDWDGFIEIYGIPACFVILPENTPKEMEDEYMAQAQYAAEGGSGALPKGSDVKFATDARGNQPFELRLEWLAKQLVLAGTGGMLTMLAESGSGTLAGGAHTESFKAIARMRARKISELLQRRIDRTVLDKAFPDKPNLAYWELASEEEQNTGDAVEQIARLSEFYIIATDDVEERTGYKIEGHRPGSGKAEGGKAESGKVESGKELLEEEHLEKTTAANRENGEAALASAEETETALIENSLTAALEAEREDLQPLIDRLLLLSDLAAMDTEESDTLLAEGLQALRKDLPGMVPGLLESPKLAQVLAQAFGTAVLNGYVEDGGEDGGLRRNDGGGSAQ